VLAKELRRVAPYAVLGLLVGLAGCGPSPELNIDRVVLAAAKNANDTTPIATDIVLTRDKALGDELRHISADQWFLRKSQVLKDHPGKLMVYSFEIVPGQVLDKEIDQDHDAWSGFVYARYLSKGDHRLEITHETVRLTFGKEDFSVAQK
jgi:type VI secretion system protein